MNGDTRLIEDLGVGSLALLELVPSIESRFDVRIHDEDHQSRKSFGTLGGVRQVVAEALIDSPAGDRGRADNCPLRSPANTSGTREAIGRSPHQR